MTELNRSYVFNVRLLQEPKPMTNFDRKKLIELVLYILDKTGGIDFYHAFKILYFAEMKHLAKWGSGIVPDEFCALKYGPVPTLLYDTVKDLDHPHTALSEDLAEVIQFAGEDAPNVLLPKREANLKFLSKSEIESLDQAINENKSLTFGQLMRKSHDKAWDEAYRCANGTNVISPISMAKVLDASDAMLEYIAEQITIESALK